MPNGAPPKSHFSSPHILDRQRDGLLLDATKPGHRTGRAAGNSTSYHTQGHNPRRGPRGRRTVCILSRVSVFTVSSTSNVMARCAKSGNNRPPLARNVRKFDSPPYARQKITAIPVLEEAERGSSLLKFRFFPFSWRTSRWPSAREAKIAAPKLSTATANPRKHVTVVEGAERGGALVAFRPAPLSSQASPWPLTRYKKIRS